MRGLGIEKAPPVKIPDKPIGPDMHLNMTAAQALAWDPFGKGLGGNGDANAQSEQLKSIFAREDAEQDRKNAELIRSMDAATQSAIQKDKADDALPRLGR